MMFQKKNLILTIPWKMAKNPLNSLNWIKWTTFQQSHSKQTLVKQLQKQCACNQTIKSNSTSSWRSRKTSSMAGQTNVTDQASIFNSKKQTMHKQIKLLSNFNPWKQKQKRGN